MAYIIAEPCIGVKDSLASMFALWTAAMAQKLTRCFTSTPKECIDCDACVPVCPVEAIFSENGLPEKWQHFAQINADYFKDKR